MELKNIWAQDLNGNILVSPTVRVYAEGTQTEIAGLKTKENGVFVDLDNPFTGTPEGLCKVAAPNGVYDVRITGSGRDYTITGVQFVDVAEQVAAAELQVANATAQANSAAGSAALAAEIANISEVQTFTIPLQLASVVAMTAAASARGITIPFGTETVFSSTDCTLHFSNIAIDWSSVSKQHIAGRQLNSANNGGNIVYNNKYLRAEARNTSTGSNTALGTSTAQINRSAFESLNITLGIDLASDGSATWYWYVNGVQLGDAVAVTAANMGYFWAGAFDWTVGSFGIADRIAMSWGGTVFYNRLLGAQGVADLCKYGVDPADAEADNANRYKSVSGIGVADWTTANATLTETAGVFELTNTATAEGRGILNNEVTAGKKYTASVKSISGTIVITAFAGLSRTTISPGQTLTVTRIATNGDKLQIGTNSTTSSVAKTFEAVIFEEIGATLHISAQDAQSDTGQVLGRANGVNGLLPPTGATVLGNPQSRIRQVKSPDHSWSTTNEMQYLSGVNQPLVPDDAAIIYADIESSDPISVNLGDESDPDRYVAAQALVAGKNRVALTSTPFCDGTNRDLTVTPTTAFNGTLSIVLSYYSGEAA